MPSSTRRNNSLRQIKTRKTFKPRSYLKSLKTRYKNWPPSFKRCKRKRRSSLSNWIIFNRKTSSGN